MWSPKEESARRKESQDKYHREVREMRTWRLFHGFSDIEIPCDLSKRKPFGSMMGRGKLESEWGLREWK